VTFITEMGLLVNRNLSHETLGPPYTLHRPGRRRWLGLLELVWLHERMCHHWTVVDQHSIWGGDGLPHLGARPADEAEVSRGQRGIGRLGGSGPAPHWSVFMTNVLFLRLIWC
jgi:hypothetical protein